MYNSDQLSSSLAFSDPGGEMSNSRGRCSPLSEEAGPGTSWNMLPGTLERRKKNATVFVCVQMVFSFHPEKNTKKRQINGRGGAGGALLTVNQ